MKSRFFNSIAIILLLSASTSMSQTWKSYTSTQEARVLLDDGNYLWIGTTGGLIKFDKISETHQLFTKDSGLSSNTIQCLHKDINNNLWVGTDAGLSFFDGVDWRSPADSPSPIRNVRDIQVDQEGSVWITGGADYGPLDPFYLGPTFAYLKAGAWKQPELEEFTGFDSPIGFCLDLSPEDGFYCGTNRGLYYISSSSWQKMDIPSSRVFDIVYDEQINTRWIAAANGLYKMKNGVITKAWGDGYEIQRIEMETPDRLWLLHKTRGLIKYENGTVSSPLNISGNVFDIKIDSNKTMWIGTEYGLTRKKGEEVKNYSFDSGLKSNDIISIASGPDGVIYFTFYVQSELKLGRFDGEKWSYYSLADVSKTYVDSKNRIWAIVSGKIYYYEGSTWTPFPVGKFVTSVSENSHGDLWFGGRDHLLYRVSHDLQERQGFSDKIEMYSTRAITALMEDENTNTLWIGISADSGILRLNLSDFTSTFWNYENSKIPYSDAQKFQSHPDGTVWAAFGTMNQGGLYYFRDNNWTRAPIDDWGPAASYISDLEIDDAGRVWFTMYGWNTGGTYGGGLGMYDGSEWRQFKANNSGLGNNFATGLALDRQGNLWISTYGGGISRFTPPPGTTSAPQQLLNFPESFKLGDAYPNPFNPSTTILFDLPSDGFVTLKIYDVTGRLVRVLVQEQKLAGAHSILWDGLNDAGQKVAAGVYLYRIEFVDAAGEKMVLTKKMSLVK